MSYRRGYQDGYAGRDKHVPDNGIAKIKENRMNWYIFSTRDEQQMATLEICTTYARAVAMAQNEIGTDTRPKRVFDGMYRLRNTASDQYRARYIVRGDAMSRYGFGHLVPEKECA